MLIFTIQCSSLLPLMSYFAIFIILSESFLYLQSMYYFSLLRYIRFHMVESIFVDHLPIFGV